MRIRIYDRWRGSTMAPPEQLEISQDQLLYYLMGYASKHRISEHRVEALDLETNKLWRLP